MTYPNENESTTELPQPAWLKALRYLVFGLILSSIFAMLSVGWAAFQIVGHKKLVLPSEIPLPDGATPLSITSLQNGDTIILFSHNGITARMVDPTGKTIGEALLK